jgi:tryptophan synthase alpha chain
MGIFVTCGFPGKHDTLPLLYAIAAGGADFIELGMPFSDPLAEGGPIQHSSEVALLNGVSLKTVLETAREFTTNDDTPLLLMGYFNPIMQYGTSNFCRDARSSGVSGLIIPDLPPEEGAEFLNLAADHELDVVLLVAPNTTDIRLAAIDALASGFVYAVSVTGLTGSGLSSTATINEYLARARRVVVRNPLLVGFGIRNSADAVALLPNVDGFIVGSALITEISRLWREKSARRLDDITRFVEGLRPSSEPSIRPKSNG